MKTNIFISFSFENENLKLIEEIKSILENSDSTFDYSEKKDRSGFSNQTIWENLLIRIYKSSVTLLVLTKDLLENNKYKISPGRDLVSSGWVYKEISASLRNWKNNHINGILVVYDDSIEIRNYKMPEIINLNKNYIKLISYSDFRKNPNNYINEVKLKREDQIMNNTYSIKHDFHN